VPVVDGVHRAIARSPLLLRPVLALFALAFLPWLLAPICVYRGVRSKMASLYVAAFGAWTLFIIDPNRIFSPSTAHGQESVPSPWLFALLATPFAIAVFAHVPPLPRWFVPCRTVAWALLWSVPVAFLVVQASPQNAMFAVIGVWVIAAAVIGWRAAKGSQEARMFGPDGVLAAYTGADGAQPPPAPASPQGPRPAGAGRRPTGPMPRGGPGGTAGPSGPAGHSPAQYGTRAQGVAQVFADRSARKRQPAAEADRSEQLITPEDALAELDAMVGLVKVIEKVMYIEFLIV
jgi:hypothetical protein